VHSLVFAAFARTLCGLMIVVSLYLLYRGHNEPGGGFVGGLVAAAGFAVIALAKGTGEARRLLTADPMVVMGVGLVCAVASGLAGLAAGEPFLAHQWTAAGALAVGTPLLFDAGVYLVVLGGVLSLILRFYEGH
jgi:multicomponent Na+:H+ antiporter subunit B